MENTLRGQLGHSVRGEEGQMGETPLHRARARGEDKGDLDHTAQSRRQNVPNLSHHGGADEVHLRVEHPHVFPFYLQYV